MYYQECMILKLSVQGKEFDEVEISTMGLRLLRNDTELYNSWVLLF